MNDRNSHSQTSHARASVWIFPWRRSFRLRWNLLLSAAFVLPIMALLLSTVRVRVFFVPPALNRSAELVVVPSSLNNLEWMAKIAQKTPFPDAARDRSIEALSADWLHAELNAGFESTQELRSVRLPISKPVFEQSWFLPALPESDAAVPVAPADTVKVLQPRVRWLSPLSSKQLPTQWPEYPESSEAIVGMKYLLEVNPQGRVLSCVPASKESDKRHGSLENWLKRLEFPESKDGLGWIAGEIIWQYDHD